MTVGNMVNDACREQSCPLVSVYLVHDCFKVAVRFRQTDPRGFHGRYVLVVELSNTARDHPEPLQVGHFTSTTEGPVRHLSPEDVDA
ncbi:hypothetical protein [Bacillus velezensis]|uniref:hypothetical protein n=1 Tax=Bacillus velezensis TaxID=492670 RepID=UPI0035D587F0